MNGIGKNREDALIKGCRLYFREKPCVKCGENLFRMQKPGDACNACIVRNRIKNPKKVSCTETHLSRIR